MKNEKGFTLVELLASLTIFFIIIGLVSGVMINVNKSYQRMSHKNNLGQEANIIIATLKTHHQKYDEYYLKYDSKNQQAFIGDTSSPTQSLGSSSTKIEFNIGINTPSPFSGVNKIVSNSPLAIHLKLYDERGGEYKIETIINKY